MKPGRAATARWHGFAALFVCLALGACGGGGGGGAEPTPPPANPNPDPGVAGAPYFPLNAGARWRYTQDGQPTTVRVLERNTVAGEQVVRLTTEEPTETTDEYFVVSASGVESLPGPNADTFTTAIGRYTRIRFPLRTGETHVLLNRSLTNVFDFDSDGRLDPLDVRVESTVVGFERVVGLHASFDNALRLRTTFTQATTLSRDNRRIVVVSTAEEWYAPEIGLVRSVVSYNDGSPTERLDLREWSVGSQRSDTVAPAAQTLAPLAGALTRSAAISLTLTEAVEADSLAEPALEVRGPDGNPVAGNVSTTDRITFRFTPSQPLANGSYTVRLLGTPADWFGNAVAPVSWSFTLDATGPTLVSATPADDSVDVAVQSSIALVFNEALDPATLAANITLSNPAGGVAVNVSVSGQTVTLTPTSALQKAVRYSVHVGTGLTDAAGNRLAAAQVFGFTTDPGRFSLPTTLAGMGPGNMVRTTMADLDNDGRPELIGTLAENLYSGQLLVLRATGAGRYANVPTALPSSCQGWPLVIDLNGDSRPDMLQSSLCGVQHWLQNADGSWAYQGLLAAAGQYQLLTLAVPLAGGGRPGLVMIGSTVELRRPAAGGGFQAAESIYGGFGYPVVGDVNGDGRADLILADTSGLNPGLVRLLQQADGSFSVQRTTMPTLRSVLLAADLDGDGRTDLVVADGEQAALLLQRSDGTLAAPVPLRSRTRPSVAQLGDVNGDGLLDILLMHSDPLTTTGFTLLTQGPAGTWTDSNPVEWDAPVGLSQGSGLQLADFNGDGRTDILYGNLLLAQRAGATTGASATGPRRARFGLRAAGAAGR